MFFCLYVIVGNDANKGDVLIFSVKKIINIRRIFNGSQNFCY
jgi:hypothetical protein